MLSLPPVSPGKAIGTLSIYTQKQKDFTKEEVGIVQAIANQAALATEKTRLIKEAQKAIEAVETKKVIDKS